MREIQALSRRVSFSSSAASLSYVPEFVAKTESALRLLPRSFGVPSLGDFAACMPEDLLLCPVCACSAYLDRTSGVVIDLAVCLYSIRGIATSSAFFRNWYLRSVLEEASWRSNTVCPSFYLQDFSFTSDGVQSLGPFVAAGERIG